MKKRPILVTTVTLALTRLRAGEVKRRIRMELGGVLRPITVAPCALPRAEKADVMASSPRLQMDRSRALNAADCESIVQN
jgi:hypothetical protein